MENITLPAVGAKNNNKTQRTVLKIYLKNFMHETVSF